MTHSVYRESGMFQESPEDRFGMPCLSKGAMLNQLSPLSARLRAAVSARREWRGWAHAGLLAAFCRAQKLTPRTVRRRPKLLEEFQALLRREGIELSWPKLWPL
ncbi:MAG TPA: hypothetical protein VFY92_08820 [Hyphomicrobiaceae bacterium]|nr:hypothetical protein [Hyphomicrobiaceae bacterium]